MHSTKQKFINKCLIKLQINLVEEIEQNMNPLHLMYSQA